MIEQTRCIKTKAGDERGQDETIFIISIPFHGNSNTMG